MSDWNKLAAADQFPFRCVSCLNAHEVLDTFVEVPAWGRVFICKQCVRTGARMYGFSKGKEQDRLETASVELAEMAKERDKYLSQRNDLGENLLKEVTDHETTLEEAAKLRGRVEQLETRLREKAAEDLSLIGGDVA